MGIHTSIFYFADGTDIFPTGSLPGGLGLAGKASEGDFAKLHCMQNKEHFSFCVAYRI